MFESIVAAQADPILGLGELFNNDERTNKINLGIGIYKDENGQTPILESVKKTEQYLLEQATSKNYLTIEGTAEFASATQELLFGKESPIILNKRAKTAQSLGGTGGLRVAAEFLITNGLTRRIWISQPSWPNHRNIFTAAGFDILEYPYYDSQNHCLDVEGMLASLQQAQPGDVVLLHGCCHNPTGIDPTVELWQALADLMEEKSLLPLFDFAYQGLGRGLDEDAEGLRLFAEKLPELIVCNSYSKNFSMYNERVGAMTLVARDNAVATTAFTQVRAGIRASYSTPPAHGAAIVSTILNNQTLRSIWEQEVADMRMRIQRMRLLFANTLQEKGAQNDYSFITQQNGMFSFSGLDEAQVQALRERFAIYIVNSGRINVAGMTLTNMSSLCEAIIAVTNTDELEEEQKPE